MAWEPESPSSAEIVFMIQSYCSARGAHVKWLEDVASGLLSSMLAVRTAATLSPVNTGPPESPGWVLAPLRRSTLRDCLPSKRVKSAVPVMLPVALGSVLVPPEPSEDQP